MHYKNKTAEIFKQRLYEEMALKNITAHKLAQKAKIGRTTLYDFYAKKNKLPNAKTLVAISKTLNVSVDYLLGLTDVRN